MSTSGLYFLASLAMTEKRHNTAIQEGSICTHGRRSFPEGEEAEEEEEHYIVDFMNKDIQR